MARLNDFDTVGWSQAQKMLLVLNLVKRPGEIVSKPKPVSKNFLR